MTNGWMAWFGWLFTAVFAVGAFPQVTLVNPIRGKPGTVVTILGDNFGFVTRVTVGGVDAQIVNRLVLQIVVPAQARSGPIYVYNQLGFDDSDEIFQVAPRITGFTPTGALPGSPDPVIIKGANFENPGFFDLPRVFFGSVESPSVFLAGDDTIQASVPFNASSGPLWVYTFAGQATTSSNFFFPPVLLKLDPPVVRAGAPLNLIGQSLSGVTSVVFPGDMRIKPTTVSSTNVTVQVPLDSPDGLVFLENPNFISFGLYLSMAPQIASIEPEAAPVGAVVALRGTGLRNFTRVVLGGKATSIASNVPPRLVYVFVPAGVATGPATVVTSNGTNTSSALFYAPPAIDSVSPTGGKVGSAVLLKGHNFTGLTNLSLGELTVSPVSVTNTEVKLVIPLEAKTARWIIRAPGGSVTSAAPFQVLGNEPILSSFTPDFGTAGTVVKVTGTNLATVTKVTFSGIPVVPTILTDNALTAKVPAGAVTGLIRVESPTGVGVSLREFQIGDEADLQATLSTVSEAAASSIVSVRLEVRNRGPLTAEPATAGISWNSGGAFVAADTGQGTLERFGSALTWKLSVLGMNGLAILDLRLQLSGVQNLEVTASIQSDRPDNNSANNLAITTVQWVVPQLQVAVVPAGIQLTWPIAAIDFALESSPGIAPPAWTAVTVNPILTAKSVQVVIPQTANRQFYRLHLP
ncbi:MAG: hypothetical protein EXS36_16190 [Pedosphaera sp.]|nr:hypothetical protein [Pedosphaera sp.]